MRIRRRKGLLFAATERAVYVSFDDGGNWQSLRQNMGVTSVRDIIVKDDDLVAARTGAGSGFSTTSRRCARSARRRESEDVVLFEPTIAWRVRWNTSTDMPWPVEEPTGPNPPDGVDHQLLPEAACVRSGDRWRSRTRRGAWCGAIRAATPWRRFREPANAPVPLYWYRAPQTLSAAAGMHRFVWDVHYQPLAG